MDECPSTPNRPGRAGLRIFLVALLPALLYFNTLWNSFQYDDIYLIVNNRYVHSLSNVWRFFVSSNLISDTPLSGYRPLTMTTFALNYALGGDNPAGYHALNIAIHVINALLVYACSLMIMDALGVARRKEAALVCALLFAVHPINTQPVNYISGRSTLLVGGFSLLSLALYLKRDQAEDGSRRVGLLAGSLVAYSCALLSKEEAVALPGVLLLYELCRTRLRLDRQWCRHVLASILPFAVVTLAFLVLAIKVLGLIGDTPQARNTTENLMTQTKAVFLYLKLLAFPTGLSIDHVVAVARSLLEPLVLASFCGLLILLPGSLLLVRSAPVIPFGIWWFFLSLVPTSTLVALKLVINEQRMYFSAIGIMLLAGAAAGAALQKINNAGARKAAYAVATVALLVLAFLTIQRNSEWRTPRTLWESALRRYPESARANAQLAVMYLQAGDPERALPLANKAVALAPDVLEPRIVLASTCSRMGLNECALEHARAAVDLNPVSSDAQAVLGTVYARMERFGEAEAAWRRALQLNPNNIEAYENLQKLHALNSVTP
ncbi:MAG: tetratricopeptide repeat protein [Candidatus Abyssubacteria bacterium]